MKKYIQIASSIILILLVSSCSNIQSLTAPTVTIPAIETNSYPAPDQILGTSYPSPDQNVITPLPDGVLPPAPEDAPQTEPNTASISGVLYTFTIKQVIPSTGFFLMPAVGPENRDMPMVIVEPEASRGEIIGTSDHLGRINLSNIPPGNYYLVIWAPMNWSIAQISEADQKAKLIELKAGDRIPLGVIYTSWP